MVLMKSVNIKLADTSAAMKLPGALSDFLFTSATKLLCTLMYTSRMVKECTLIKSILEDRIANPPKTMLTGLFELCKTDYFAKTLLYFEMPQYF